MDTMTIRTASTHKQTLQTELRFNVPLDAIGDALPSQSLGEY